MKTHYLRPGHRRTLCGRIVAEMDLPGGEARNSNTTDKPEKVTCLRCIATLIRITEDNKPRTGRTASAYSARHGGTVIAKTESPDLQPILKKAMTEVPGGRWSGRLVDPSRYRK